MQLKVLIPILIMFAVLVALSIYFAVDAFKHMEQSLEIQKEFKSFCGGVEIVNCTSMVLKSVVESTQHLLVAVVEILASAIFIILAIYILFAMIKIWIGLND